MSKPIKELTISTANSIKYVLCDIDDTLTTGGKLTAEAYSARGTTQRWYPLCLSPGALDGVT